MIRHFDLDKRGVWRFFDENAWLAVVVVLCLVHAFWSLVVQTELSVCMIRRANFVNSVRRSCTSIDRGGCISTFDQS